jgi:putative peptide maturation system protein
MNAPFRQTLNDTLDFLMALAREGARPEEARARLPPLRGLSPDTDIDLVWEEQAYDRSVHYDALLHVGGEGTVSLSFCPERGLPWPLRGVQRWSDQDLLRVNHTVLRVDQAIACLDFIWDEAPVLQRLVDACLIQESLEKEPVELSGEELQRALDAFRRAHKLYKAEDTRRWMERRGLTHEQLERLVADEATVAKLRDRVAAGRVEAYFAGHRADFDTAAVARLGFADAASARRTGEEIRSGRVDFYEAAQRHFLAAGRPGPPPGELFAVVQRRQAPPELAPAFAAEPGAVLGPVPSGEGFLLVRVLSRTAARLDEATGAAIKRILFEEWLGKRRRAARVEWFWGTAAETAAG